MADTHLSRYLAALPDQEEAKAVAAVLTGPDLTYCYAHGFVWGGCGFCGPHGFPSASRAAVDGALAARELDKGDDLADRLGDVLDPTDTGGFRG